MNEQKIHFVTLETSSLDEYNQRELNAYRNVGSVREFRRLKHQEMNRRERRQRLYRSMETLLAGVVFAITVVTCICLIAVLA